MNNSKMSIADYIVRHGKKLRELADAAAMDLGYSLIHGTSDDQDRNREKAAHIVLQADSFEKFIRALDSARRSGEVE